MSHKRRGQITVSGEWAKHLRPFLRRAFWKTERQATHGFLRKELGSSLPSQSSNGTLESLLAAIDALPPEVENAVEIRGQWKSGKSGDRPRFILGKGSARTRPK
jgi:hypothetical protein